MRKYYEAYDDRYRQVHALGLSWTDDAPSPIVREVLARYAIGKSQRILEIGAGEGRDALGLLSDGYHLLASDVSPEAVEYCRRKMPQYAKSFTVLDAVEGMHDGTYDFIYAVAVIHMLTADTDRAAFLAFIRNHLTDGGIALVCSMGDGVREYTSDSASAFDLRKRVHEPSGRELMIASTSCRTVNRESFLELIDAAGLRVLSYEVREDVPGFDKMMCAVLTAKKER